MELNNPDDLEEKLAKTSKALFNTAFKAAFVARMILESRRHQKKRSARRALVPRDSFDDEINDIIELIHLWINSGLDADFYQYAFPDDMTQTG